MKYRADKGNIYRYPFNFVWNAELVSEPLNVSEKQKIRTKFGIQEEHMLILVGQMIHRKGFDILLRAVDVFVLPMRDDPWGLAINKAMENGFPVITTTRCIAGLEMVETHCR